MSEPTWAERHGYAPGSIRDAWNDWPERPPVDPPEIDYDAIGALLAEKGIGGRPPVDPLREALAESASIGIHVRDEHPGDFVACRDGMCVEARRLLAASERPPVDPLREAIHRSKDGCNGRPHTRWFMGPNKCDRLAALASPAAPRPEGPWTFEPLTDAGWAILAPDDDERHAAWQADGYGTAIALDRADAERIVAALNGVAAPRPERLTREALASALAEVLAPPVDPVRGGFTELAERILARLSPRPEGLEARLGDAIEAHALEFSLKGDYSEHCDRTCRHSILARLSDTGGTPQYPGALNTDLAGDETSSPHRPDCLCSVCYVKRP